MAGLYVNERGASRPHRLRLSGRRVVGPSGVSSVGHSAPDKPINKGDCVDLLTRMVEGEIIPRLLLAHDHEGLPPSRPGPQPVLGPNVTEQFARMVLSNEVDSLLDFVGALIARGATLPAIYMDLLGPTARKLGDYWNDDYCSFADVTIGLGRLQQILHELGRRSAQAQEAQRRGRSALLVTAPNEQHTFGLLVIEEFFRRAGWRTWCEPGGDCAVVAQMVSAQWYDLFGLSVSCDAHLDQVAAIITSVRRSSKNHAIRVMVGGRLFIEHPELVTSVGADVAAAEGNEAVAKAENAVSQLEGRC